MYACIYMIFNQLIFFFTTIANTMSNGSNVTSKSEMDIEKLEEHEEQVRLAAYFRWKSCRRNRMEQERMVGAADRSSAFFVITELPSRIVAYQFVRMFC